jgi:hypothetical protein
MAVALILEFPKHGRAEYYKVNSELGLDTISPHSSWPDGLLNHTAGTKDDGSLVIMEVWDSRESHYRFLDERLRPALMKAGVTSTPEITWIDVVTSTAPHAAAR